jgi:DNA-binding winged helix-turn-helix (wHTH) protein
MVHTVGATARVTFGVFEVDLQTGELWKAGRRIKIQTQPFKVLAALLERPGEVVTREELQTRVWGPDTTVDFDHSIGTAINKVREALGDSADSPRYVETLARRGYRFIAPVTAVAPELVSGKPEATVPAALATFPRMVEAAPKAAMEPVVAPARSYRTLWLVAAESWRRRPGWATILAASGGAARCRCGSARSHRTAAFRRGRRRWRICRRPRPMGCICLRR